MEIKNVMDKKSPAKTGTPTGQPVSQAAAGTLPRTIPLGSGAHVAAINAGGQPGGRPTVDGTVPGSPEYIEARRKRDAERKKAARAVATSLERPAALPTVLPNVSGAAPALGVSPGSGDVLLVTPKAPWTSAMLEPATRQIVNFWEEADITNLEKKSIAANLPEPVRKDLLVDAHFPAEAKAGVVEGSAELLAEGLNYVGIDSKYNKLVGGLTSLALIAKHKSDTNKRLDELIELQKQALAKPGGTP